MANSIMAIFFFLSTHTFAIDIGNDNQKITLQADVETIVINLPLAQTNRTTNELLQSVRELHKDLTGLVSNTIKGEGNRHLKMLRAMLLNAEEYIVGMSERLNGLFRQDVQDRKKRAFEILGELISTISRVPSAQDHRALLEKVKMLKLDADGVKQLMRDQARNNEQILQTIHTHDTEIDNLENNMATAFTNLKITSGWLINSVAVMTCLLYTSPSPRDS